MTGDNYRNDECDDNDDGYDRVRAYTVLSNALTSYDDDDDGDGNDGGDGGDGRDDDDDDGRWNWDGSGKALAETGAALVGQGKASMYRYCNEWARKKKGTTRTQNRNCWAKEGALV